MGDLNSASILDESQKSSSGRKNFRQQKILFEIESYKKLIYFNFKALAAAQERQGTAEEHVRQLEASLEEKTSDLSRFVINAFLL